MNTTPQNRPLTVGHVVGTLDHAGAGVASAVAGLCSHLASQPNLTVMVASATTGGAQYPTPSQVKRTQCRSWAFPRLRLHWAPGFPRMLEDAFSAPPVDLIHCHGLWIRETHAACQLASRHKKPLIITTHGMLTPWSLRHKAWKKKIAWRFYQQKDILGAALLHATSTEEAQGLRELGLSQPIIVIPNGIDLPVWRVPDNGKTPFTALFMGRIHPVKGLLNLIDAWAQVRPDNWQCVLAGPDESGHRAELEARIRQHSLEAVFSFTGNLAGDMKWELYRQADLFILPSFTENFGIVVAEALSCGVPAIATHGAPWESLKQTQCGWHIPIGVSPLADTLREATRLPSQTRQEMGVRGRQLVEDCFGWPLVAKKMHHAYEWMLHGGIQPDYFFHG